MLDVASKTKESNTQPPHTRGFKINKNEFYKMKSKITLPAVPSNIALVCFLVGVKVCHNGQWLHGTNFAADGWAKTVIKTALEITKEFERGDIDAKDIYCALCEDISLIRDDLQSVDIRRVRENLSVLNSVVFEQIGYLALSEFLLDGNLAEKLGKNHAQYVDKLIEMFQHSLGLYWY